MTTVTTEPYTEREVLDALYIDYQATKMNGAVIRHVPLGLSSSQPGFYDNLEKQNTIRYIDALILKKDRLWAVEVKVSRSDLRRELANPSKSMLWREHTHSFYFAVTPDLIEFALDVVPVGFGVMCPWRLRGAPSKGIHRRAKNNPDPTPLPDELWRRLGMRLGKYQHEASA